MAIPLLFGHRNAVNPTPYLDGGLHDNLPAAGLRDRIGSGDLDYLLVIDVSSTAKFVRERVLGPRVPSATPMLYLGLARSRRCDGLTKLLDFRLAAPLFAKGRRAGRIACQRWFASPHFDPRSAACLGSSILPKCNVIRVP